MKKIITCKDVLELIVGEVGGFYEANYVIFPNEAYLPVGKEDEAKYYDKPVTRMTICEDGWLDIYVGA